MINLGKILVREVLTGKDCYFNPNKTDILPDILFR